MIFVTVGSQMPFDRLVRALDMWAMNHPEQKVIAQIGDTDFVPKAMAFDRSVAPSEFVRRMKEAEVVVAHAGMGTIISAAEFGKPMVLLPRRGGLRETRNDHQVATAKWLRSKPGIFVADTEDDLPEALAAAVACSSGLGLSVSQPGEMIGNLKSIIDQL